MLITINILEDLQQFEITGEIHGLQSNRRINSFLVDFLNAHFGHDSILVPYKVSSQNQILNNLQQLFKQYSIKHHFTTKVQNVLSEFLLNEYNFEFFSNEAKNIWENKINIQDFKDFSECIKKHLPTRTLYYLQLLASFHLAFSQNACNFSVPGSGKTSIVFAAYSFLKNLASNNVRHVNKLLVIGPLSSFAPWEMEYEKCFGEKPSSKRLSGGVSKEEREYILNPVSSIDESPELLLMSYQTLCNEIENVKNYLNKKGNNVMVILDEAHKIKNTDGGVWAQAALNIAPFCKARVVLTGTPMPNGYEDLYNLYKFIWPDKDILKFHLFQLRDMTNNRFDPRVKNLINNASSFFIRITKKNLKEQFGLPSPIENPPITVPMGLNQRKIYDFIENKYLSYFQNTQENQWSSTLLKARIIRLLQASSNINLLKNPLDNYFNENEIGNQVFIDDREILKNILEYSQSEIPAKFLATLSLIKKIINNNQKVIIWTTFIQTAKELKTFLAYNNIQSELLIGEIPVEIDDTIESVITREKIIKEFHNPSSKFKVIIANPFAVSESISLHMACHNAIYLERTFNASQFIQSKDRIHRVGLNIDDKINYYYLLAENSIEQTVHDRLIYKEKRMLEIIENQPIPLFEKNMDYDVDFESDLKAIIRDYVRKTTRIQ
ncbi:MAG: DEAD/DEAH box helicase [Ignavibacteria bacterium]|nr:DEAD/DEAH box helicase [Ignavibacteria bacterium]